jgi:hypothetical protein
LKRSSSCASRRREGRGRRGPCKSAAVRRGGLRPWDLPLHASSRFMLFLPCRLFPPRSQIINPGGKSGRTKLNRASAKRTTRRSGDAGVQRGAHSCGRHGSRAGAWAADRCGHFAVVARVGRLAGAPAVSPHHAKAPRVAQNLDFGPRSPTGFAAKPPPLRRGLFCTSGRAPRVHGGRPAWPRSR